MIGWHGAKQPDGSGGREAQEGHARAHHGRIERAGAADAVQGYQGHRALAVPEVGWRRHGAGYRVPAVQRLVDTGKVVDVIGAPSEAGGCVDRSLGVADLCQCGACGRSQFHRRPR